MKNIISFLVNAVFTIIVAMYSSELGQFKNYLGDNKEVVVVVSVILVLVAMVSISVYSLITVRKLKEQLKEAS
jgi:cell division protein FtsX